MKQLVAEGGGSQNTQVQGPKRGKPDPQLHTTA